MTTESTQAADLSTSIWKLLDNINTILDTGSPLAEQLQEINRQLIRALCVDAVWCSTLAPLPVVACGLLKTPLRMAPNAEIDMVDAAPPVEQYRDPSSLLGQVIASQTPYFFTGDCQETKNNEFDADLGDVLFETFETRPLAVIPLVASRQTWGVLVVGKEHQAGDPLSSQTKKLLGVLSRHLGKNLQSFYLLERTQRHAGTIIALNQIAQTITSSLDIDDVIHKTMAGINNILNVDAGSLLWLDENSNELLFKITLRGENKQVTSYRLAYGEGIAGWVVAHQQPAIVNDVTQDDRFSGKIDKAIGFKTKTVLCAPLVVQGKAIGALEVINKRNGLFNEHDQYLLVSIAAALGIALHNATLYHDARHQAEATEEINRVTAAINAGLDLSEMGKLIHTQFKRMFTFDHISFALIDHSTETVRQWNVSEYGCIEEKGAPIAIEGSRLAEVVTSWRSVVKEDISKSETAGKRYPDDQILRTNEIRSFMTVPLVAHNKPYGGLTIGSRQPGTYDRSTLALLEQIAPQVAIVIDKGLLIERLEQQTNELQLLNRLGEMLASTVDLRIIIDTTIKMLPRLLPNDVHGLFVTNEDGAHVGVAVPFGFHQPERIIDILAESFQEFSQVENIDIVSQKIIPGNIPVADDWQPVTALSLPLLTRRKTQGIIYVGSGKKETFSHEILRIFSLLASQISSAIANANLFQQVERERARLEAILVSITDAVLVVNRSGRIVLDNPAAQAILNVQTSQSGRLLSETTTMQRLIDLFETAMQGGSTTGELVLEDGRTFYANLAPVEVGQSGVTGWLATMRDVSRFKEIDDLKNEFVSTVSHDLRSPLSSILMATKLVEQLGETNEEQDKLLSIIETRIGRMSEFIDDLLDVGRIEAGLDMSLEPADLEEVVKDVVSALVPQAAKKMITLEAVFDEDVPPVMSNVERMRQVAHNLIGNALKYTPEEGKVTVKIYGQDDEVRLQVIDTGIGIPASDQPHVFEKFYRVRGKHALKTKGSGLGLSIVKSIVEKHNGRIWLESVRGQGSTFTVALPAAPNRN